MDLKERRASLNVLHGFDEQEGEKVTLVTIVAVTLEAFVVRNSSEGKRNLQSKQM